MGAAGNANYMQMVDFVLGLAGIDIAGDDGRPMGLWPWESEETRQASSVADWVRRTVFGQESVPRARRVGEPRPWLSRSPERPGPSDSERPDEPWEFQP